MKIALAQQNYHVGNFEGNLQKMLAAVAAAKAQGADLICFPELATTGYPPRDFLEFNDFIERAYQVVNQLLTQTHDIAIVVGSIAHNPVLEGKPLFNAAFFLAEGKIKHVQHKALLPTYDIFDEYRYFEPAKQFEVVTYKGKRIAITICEDLWNLGNENPLYTICPMDQLMPQQPDLMINLSASPFAYDHAQERIHVLRANVERYQLPLFYVNQVGGQTEILFDGGSIVMSPNGSIVAEMPYFEECLRVFELENVMANQVHHEQAKDKIALIHGALIMGIRDYFRKLGLSKAILGLSGGIDSAVVAVLAAEALGKENIRVLLLPSQFSSDHSVLDARLLAQNIGIQYDILPIESIYTKYIETLTPHFWATPFGLTEENLQARIRGMLLMSFSNKFGHILLNTSNKSEMAVGYGTLYGDMCGGLSVIGDVYKTEVYALAHYLNRNQVVIPMSIIEKAPSAELRPNQKDTDSLPDYEILDTMLYQYIEQRKDPKALLAMGFEENLVKRVLKLVNNSEFKRFQTAPVLRVSSKAFGMGRRMPIEAKYLS